MIKLNSTSAEGGSACTRGVCCDHDVVSIGPIAAAGATVFRVATMDCASEEGEIRCTLESLPGIRSLCFQLGARTLTIDADAQNLQPALAAIRKIGFDPQPSSASRARVDYDDGLDSHDHSHAHVDHEHGAGSDIGRQGAALALAAAAEALSFFAPAVPVWQVAGMAVAAVAIWLAGFDTYKKGLGAEHHGWLNVNALMSVTVTGAFVLGQPSCTS